MSDFVKCPKCFGTYEQHKGCSCSHPGKVRDMSPKICECGKQGFIIDSRQESDHVQRRYRCECGARWSSFEMKLEDGVYAKDVNEILARRYSTVDRDNIAKQLMTLAMGLVK